MRARIYRSAQRIFDCLIDETGQMVEAKALGNLLKSGEIVVGDYVELDHDKEKNEYVIQQVLERKNEIFRYKLRENKKKVSASNLDLICIVVSASSPAYKRGLVDRYLVRCSQWGIPAALIFNKMDQYEKKRVDEQVDLKFESERLEDLNVPCYEVAALDKNYRPKFLSKGIDELKQDFFQKTILFQGQSGVGKSCLINSLTDGKVDLKTGKLGKVGKGKHTTTWSELVNCGEFFLIDSPGIRSFALDDLLAEDLIFYFPDLSTYTTKCQFRNCAHDEQTKGCAFLPLRNGSNPKSQYVLSRLESYLHFYSEISARPSWQKKDF